MLNTKTHFTNRTKNVCHRKIRHEIDLNGCRWKNVNHDDQRFIVWILSSTWNRQRKKWNSREWNHASVCFVKWEHSCTMRRLVLMEFRFKIIEIRFCNRFAINLSIIFSSISRILLVNSILFNISLGHFIKMILIGNLRQFEISISNKRWTFSLYAPKSIEFLKHYDLAM